MKLVEPVDATIVGYFLTPAGRVETFLLALYNEEAHQFEACGRTRAGLSAEDIQTVLALIETETGQDPALPVVTNEMPDVWVKPRFIFEFLADYRYLSNQYLCAKMQTGQGWGLHSPVFRSAEPRPDKEGHHTTTIEQFLKLRIEAGEMPEEPSTQTGVSEQVTGQQLGFTWDAPVEDSGK